MAYCDGCPRFLRLRETPIASVGADSITTQDYLGVIVGMHVWNLADFKTDQSNRRTGRMNFRGVFTRDRRPKMAAHFLRQRWNGDQS
jgi:hypothetical protein